MASFSRTLAVDLGASVVRIAEIGPDAKGRPAILALEQEEISYDPAKTSDFFPLYSQALQALVGRLGTKTRTCQLNLGGPAVFSRILKIPVADPAKVGAVIGFEAQQTVPAIEQAFWDYQLLPTAQPGESEGLILAIKKETVEEMTAAAATAGLKTMGVTLAPAALVNCFLFNYPDVSGSSLLLEIGARASTILLVEGNRLFVRVVPLGGAAVTQAIAADLQESFAGAETLKRAKGFVHPGGAYEDSPDAATTRISKLARGVMTRLLAEVERSITFFRSQQGGGKPVRAWLAGGGVALGYTDLFFAEKLRIPVEYFQPFRRLSLAGTVNPQAIAQRYAAWGCCVGGGIQSLPQAPVKINVLGSAGLSRAQKTKTFPSRVIGTAALAGLLFLPGLHGFWEAAKTGNRLAGEQQKVEEASQSLAKLEAAQKSFQIAVQQSEQVLSLEEERLRWPRLLEELKRKCPPRLWITSFQVVSAPPSEPGPKGAGKPAPPATVEIGGMFETYSEKADSEAVENFKKALTEGKILTQVAVLERETPSYRDGKTDQVALKFRLKAEWPKDGGDPKSAEKKPAGGGP